MPARRISRRARNRSGHLLAEGRRIFLPDHLDQVRAIAMRGFDEEQISELFDISQSQINRWKKQFPAFKEALEDGYTDADAAVLSALYQSAVGYTHDEEKIFQWDGEIIRADTEKHYKPDINAIKLWLTNRQSANWRDRKETKHSGDADAPIGLRDETRMEVISSILALIKPKPDNPGVTIEHETGKVEDDALDDR